MLIRNFEHENTHVGAELGASRVAMGLSVQDVGARLHIQSTYLEAVERLDTEALPSIGYMLGYVRTYARFLGMDEKDAIARYKADINAPRTSSNDRLPHFSPKRHLSLPKNSVAIGAVLSCAFVVVSWYGMKSDAVSAESAQSASALPASAVTESAPITQEENWGFEAVEPINNVADMISLKAVGPSWVKVTDIDGTVLISHIMVPGEIFETHRKNAPLLSLRDAGAIELYLGGERIGPIGQRGESAKNIPLADVSN